MGPLLCIPVVQGPLGVPAVPIPGCNSHPLYSLWAACLLNAVCKAEICLWVKVISHLFSHTMWVWWNFLWMAQCVISVYLFIPVSSHSFSRPILYSHQSQLPFQVILPFILSLKTTWVFYCVCCVSFWPGQSHYSGSRVPSRQSKYQSQCPIIIWLDLKENHWLWGFFRQEARIHMQGVVMCDFQPAFHIVGITVKNE